MRQLWGNFRPLIVALYAGMVLFLWNDKFLPVIVLITFLMLLATLTATQIVFKRQRYPVPTKKALTVTATALLLTILLAIFLWAHHPGWLPVIVLVQPLTLALAWLLWYPIDTFLKKKILAQARTLRDKHTDLTVIGVTGSVGKTTTKELLACVLKDLAPAVTPAYLNAEIGVARWIIGRLRITDYGLQKDSIPQSEIRNSQLLIVEMGAYRKGEIETLCSFTKPTIGVVTHIGTQHIALFGSQEKLFDAKSELVRSLPSDGRAFVNGDNEQSRKMAAISPCPAVIVGTGGQCDLEAFDIEETTRGIHFKARDVIFDVPLHGTHNITNVLLAIAVGEHLGLRVERMRDHLKTFAPLSQTFSVRTEAGVRILDDTHNSSVASVKAAIAWARNQPEQHKILLTAGLIEMGEMQSPAEQELGALAGNVFERTIVTDPQSARNFAAGGARNLEAFSTKSMPVLQGSLIVCTGRMSASTIKHFLPPIHNS